MKSTFWITVDRKGKNAKLSKNCRRVEPWEICFPLEINIPDSYFDRPQLEATVSFDDYENVISKIDTQGLAETINEATGIALNIKCVAPESEQD